MIIPSALAVSYITASIDETATLDPGIWSFGLGWAGLVVTAGALGILLELTAIILRFLNIGFINVKINYFLATVS